MGRDARPALPDSRGLEARKKTRQRRLRLEPLVECQGPGTVRAAADFMLPYGSVPRRFERHQPVAVINGQSPVNQDRKSENSNHVGPEAAAEVREVQGHHVMGNYLPARNFESHRGWDQAPHGKARTR